MAAESEAKQPPQPQQQTQIVEDSNNNCDNKLKYLDFVQVAALYACVIFTTSYECAKENSGPLKPGVQAVEATVKTVIGPIYYKFHDVPFEFLKFIDRKVDESLCEVDKHVPLLVKQASRQARAVACEVQREGVMDASKSISKAAYVKYEPTVRELCMRYEPVAEQYAVWAWRSLNQLPLFPRVAQVVVPAAAYWSERYNRAVWCAMDKGYVVVAYLPLIPVERIAKAFEDGRVNGKASTVRTNGNK